MIHFDFEALLLLGTLLTGVIWLIDTLFFAKSRRLKAEGNTEYEPIIIEYSRSFFPVLLAVLVLRGFLLEPFRIPSGSMMPTLLIGDFILVNKFSYGIRLPVIHTKLTEGDKLKRGDVAVFRFPEDESLDFIKRVIGLPGDRISYYNRRLTINGKELDVKLDRVYEGQGTIASTNMKGGEIYQEKLDGAMHMMMTDPDIGFTHNGELVVPEGKYFVMGDNRDHSNDSRFWGFVPEQNLVGKAIMIWMHWDWRDGGSGLDLSRIGTEISI